jgi:hypothetical protein
VLCLPPRESDESRVKSLTSQFAFAFRRLHMCCFCSSRLRLSCRSLARSRSHPRPCPCFAVRGILSGNYQKVSFNGACIDICPTLHFVDSDGVCTACSDECYGDCAGPGPANCTSCRSYDQDGVCVAQCGSDYFPVAFASPLTNDTLTTTSTGSSSTTARGGETSAAGHCVACHSLCSGCYGEGPTACIACDVSAVRIETTDPNTFEVSVECAADCPSTGFFVDVIDGTGGGSGGPPDLVCSPCHWQCAGGLCGGPSARNCTAGCAGYDYEGECVATCPAGTYLDTSSSQCLPCADGCAWCTGPASTDCTTSCNQE